MSGSSSKLAAIVLGASGSVGQAVVRELVRDGGFAPVVVLVRRSMPEQVALARDAGVELREIIVPAMEPAALAAATTAAVAALAGDAVGFSTLGVGAGTGKLTIEQHRAVDVELNAAFARGLKASGRVSHLAFMSAVGANPGARASGSGAAGMPRYARVKGEAEEAVKASGLAVVSIFRPATILGSQHTPRVLEKVLPVFGFLTPSKLKSITVDQIAQAMVATAHARPAESAVYHHREMLAAGRAPHAG
ncbi:MAG TPA: NAD(P)H-binding protein [Kofleriaceae bacterium]|nr:NAD(P)H-binding protein [Kofleriaceae bacterium]